MKIAQVAPLAEAVPPKLYGGTERVVSWLTESLVEQGHDVTLFATGDSETSARLEPVIPCGLRLAGISEHLASNLVMVEQVRRRAQAFDVIHFHVDLIQFPICRDIAQKTVTTIHGRLDLPDFHPIYRCFPEAPLVSISDDQRRHMAVLCNWRRTIHHGLPRDLLPFSSDDDGYLAFLGRISPEKRPDRAIEIAKAAGIPLRIAAKVDKVDEEYFRQSIQPMIDGTLIQFIGEIDDSYKGAFLGKARALLFPIDWCEPFGLVMIEAMATGTPVIAWPHGSVIEVVEPGVTGWVVDLVPSAVEAISRLGMMSRETIRARFEARFTADRMAQQYVQVYAELISGAGRSPHVVIDKSCIDSAGYIRRPVTTYTSPRAIPPAPEIVHSLDLFE